MMTDRKMFHEERNGCNMSQQEKKQTALRFYRQKEKQPSRIFTLVEMLVVIGIIASRAGMLLPALNSARKTAIRADCTSNFKQIMLGVSQYVMDGGDWYPSPSGWGNNCTDGHAAYNIQKCGCSIAANYLADKVNIGLGTYALGSITAGVRSRYTCRMVSKGKEYTRNTIGGNSVMRGTPTVSYCYKSTQILHPSKLLFWGEISGYGDEPFATSAQVLDTITISTRHGQAAIGYYDAHVETHSRNDMRSAPNKSLTWSNGTVQGVLRK